MGESASRFVRTPMQRADAPATPRERQSCLAAHPARRADDQDSPQDTRLDHDRFKFDRSCFLRLFSRSIYPKNLQLIGIKLLSAFSSRGI
jgi:hypothetical protein